eukprot:6471470-Amphidinium_carterae.1
MACDVETALLVAACPGDLQMVQWCLLQESFPHELMLSYCKKVYHELHMTALHLAAIKGKELIVAVL